MSQPRHKPDRYTLARAEELLREELLDRGIAITQLSPQEIATGMHCAVYPNGGLCYSWKGTPLLTLEPDEQPDRSVKWRFYTGEMPTKH